MGVIRKAVPSDAEAMAKLDEICFTVPWSTESFLSDLNNPGLALYLVAEDDEGHLIGYAGLWAILDEGHITNVAVHPAHRKKGLGTLILGNLLNVSEEAGLCRHTLEVRPSNGAALALYGSFGFQEAGRRKGYYEDNGEDALILWRESPLYNEAETAEEQGQAPGKRTDGRHCAADMRIGEKTANAEQK